MLLNRVVALLTPVFSAVAGLASAYAAKHGLNLSAEQVTVAEIGAATAGGAAALKWLHGSQAFEKIEADAKSEALHIAAYAQSVGVNVPALESEAEAKIATLVQELADSVHREGTARTELAHAKATVETARRVFADPNLVIPDAPEQGTREEAQPPVAPNVPAVAEQVVTQPAVAPDVASIQPQQQVT